MFQKIFWVIITIFAKIWPLNRYCTNCILNLYDLAFLPDDLWSPWPVRYCGHRALVIIFINVGDTVHTNHWLCLCLDSMFCSSISSSPYSWKHSYFDLICDVINDAKVDYLSGSEYSRKGQSNYIVLNFADRLSRQFGRSRGRLRLPPAPNRMWLAAP